MLFSFSCQQTQNLPPIQRGTAEGDFTPSEGVVIGRLRRPGMPPSGGGDKRGQGHHMVPLPPLDSPKTLLCAATPFGRAAKREKRGLGSVRRADLGTLLCPEFSLRKPQRCQCAAIRCRATAFCCEKLRFDQGCALGAPDAPVGPSHLDARPKGVASKGKVGESRGAGKPWCPCPSCPRRRAAAMHTPSEGVKSPPPAAPLYRRR